MSCYFDVGWCTDRRTERVRVREWKGLQDWSTSRSHDFKISKFVNFIEKTSSIYFQSLVFYNYKPTNDIKFQWCSFGISRDFTFLNLSHLMFNGSSISSGVHIRPHKQVSMICVHTSKLHLRFFQIVSDRGKIILEKTADLMWLKLIPCVDAPSPWWLRNRVARQQLWQGKSNTGTRPPAMALATSSL